MREIIEDGKYTSVDDNGKIVCVIENLGNDVYKAVNKFTQIIAEIKVVDDYRTSLKCIENKKADKNGIFRKNKKLEQHNIKWLAYMLE